MFDRLVWIWVLAFSAGGCATWSKPSEAETKVLPAPRMSPDTVVLEITFVEMPDGDAEDDADLWTEIDEQAVPIELRRRLEANGLRCGHVGAQLPAALRQQLDAQPELTDLLAGDVSALDNSLAGRHERRQMRAGQPAKIVATKHPREKMVVLLSEEGSVRGTTFDQAQCVFRVRAYPTGDSRARLELSPEIHHGEMRQRWVGYEGALRLDADRPRKTFDELTIQTILSAGQTLIVGGTDEPKGLGGQFFSTGEQGGGKRHCLLIRLAQTQVDDLFAPVQTPAPIAAD